MTIETGSISFPFLFQPRKIKKALPKSLHEFIALDVFLSNLLFEPYLKSPEAFYGFDQWMNKRFGQVNALSNSRAENRSIYYKALLDWFKEYQEPIANSRCPLVVNHGSIAIICLRSICTVVYEGSSSLQNYIHCNGNPVDMKEVLKELSNIKAYLQKEYDSTVGLLFSNLIEKVSELHKRI